MVMNGSGIYFGTCLFSAVTSFGTKAYV